MDGRLPNFVVMRWGYLCLFSAALTTHVYMYDSEIFSRNAVS